MSSISLRIDHGVCSAGLSTTQLPAARAGAELPHGHQDREVPRDDLADDAERLVEVVGDGVLVDLADRALLAAQDARRSSGSGRRPAAGRRRASRGRPCRCPRSRRRRASRGSASMRSAILLRMSARSASDVRPQAGAAAWAASSAASMSSAVPRATSQNGLAVDRRDVLEVAALLRVDPVAADEVAVAVEDGDERVRPTRAVRRRSWLISQHPWWCPLPGVGATLGSATLRPRCAVCRRAGSAPVCRAARGRGGSLDVLGSANHRARPSEAGCAQLRRRAELAVEPGDLAQDERLQRRAGPERARAGPATSRSRPRPTPSGSTSTSGRARRCEHGLAQRRPRCSRAAAPRPGAVERGSSGPR